MAVQLLNLRRMDDHEAIREAASQGLKTMESFIGLLSNQDHRLTDCSSITDLTVSKFKKVISLLNRTGHARFRRGPVPFPCPSPSQAPPHAHPPPTRTPLTVKPAPVPAQAKQCLTLDFTNPGALVPGHSKGVSEIEFTKDSFSVSSSSSFLSSAITGDGSVSNGKQGSSLFIAPAASAGKPPVSSVPFKKRWQDHDHSDNASGRLSASSSAKCHCSKRRYDH